MIKIIPSADLVPGDIALLESGDRVSADGRIVIQSHFCVDESSLTGESQAIAKKTAALPDKLSPPTLASSHTVASPLNSSVPSASICE